LAVLLAFVVGAELGGIVGAVLVLPMVAVYPIIERIWLGRFLGRQVIEEHVALDDAADGKNEDSVVDGVIRGVPNPL
jgi:hypothetical protein